MHDYLDKIASCLSCGEAWHRKVANENRKIGIRGFGQWHDAEAKCDQHSLACLQKLMQDNLKYAPNIDSAHRTKAEHVTMEGISCFKEHFKLWKEREEVLLEALTAAIPLMRDENIQLYEELCELKKEVQNEIFRLECVYNNLEFAGWMGHDISVKSKWLHDYFECDYSGGLIDFNIG